MKRIYSIFAASLLLLAASCSQEIVYPVSYNVLLDSSNTYLAGDPVKFNFTGEVDNLLFYSGETNHQYIYKDRYNVGIDDIVSANLHIDYQARYGYTDGLSVYVSNSFEGLTGDFDTDRLMIRDMVDGGMAGWTRLDYEEGASTVWTSQDYDISEFASNFVLAFHWNPRLGSSAQRHYWLNGSINIEIKGAPSSAMDFAAMEWEAIMLNEEYTQGHYSLSANPGFNMTKPGTAVIMINGCNGPSSLGGAGGPEYAHDGWIFTKAKALTKVSNDSGVVVKNLQNYLDTYEYVFDEPGTYKVTFVGINRNVEGSDKVLKEMTINIYPKDI